MQFDLTLPDFGGKDVSDSLEGIKGYLALLNEQLTFMMSNLDSDNLSDSLSGDITTVKEVRETAGRIEKQISDLSGSVSSFEMDSNRIGWLVSGTDESSFALTENAINVISSLVDVTGYVRFTDLSGSGTSVINGANITTGSISADKLGVSELSALGASIGGFDISSYSICSDATDGSSVELFSAGSGSNCWLRTKNGYGDVTFALYKNGDCLLDGDFLVNGTVSAEKIATDNQMNIDLKSGNRGMSIGPSLLLSNSSDQKRIFLNTRGDLVFDTGGNCAFTFKLDRSGNTYTLTLCDGAGNALGTVPFTV